uniref:Uncharacterized protein n=1 Tax=Anguilla anguilla TaxID=7936 RepID=A0A0E9UEY8_ANGAN
MLQDSCKHRKPIFKYKKRMILFGYHRQNSA